MKKISIIVPAYNEEDNLPAAIQRLSAVILGLQDRYTFEVIVLDNASRDRTRELALAQCRVDPRWKYLRYSRNFGVESSMLAGIDHATGDAIINVFSDMQDPPEQIPRMIALWEQGAEIVYGLVQERNDFSYLKTLGAKIAYKMIRVLADCDIPENATDFRLIDRKAIEVLKQMREPDRYLRGLVHWTGFRQMGLPYDRAKRDAGSSTANIWYCVKFALHAVLCFSSKPVHIAMILGLILMPGSILLGLVYTVFYFVRPAFLHAPPPGLTTLILLVLFVIGLNSLFLGIIGEYVGRIYNQGKHRPLYIVAESANL
jgi:dolichol-phosphate mannosyltransferase